MRRAVARDSELLEAMREVDALTPGSPPITPKPIAPGQLVEVQPRPGWRLLPSTWQYMRESDGFKVTCEHVDYYGWPQP